MTKSRKLKQSEREIMRELIKNPRISDNQISKNTQIPVMTVNRQRKALEKEGILKYYTSIGKHQDGIGTFNVRQLYIVKLKAGITRKNYLQMIELDPNFKWFNCKYISTTLCGEKNGHLAITMILDAVDDTKLMEEFNGKIIPLFKSKFGTDAVEDIITTRINDTIRIHHNYLPQHNMEEGVIKKDWPNEMIFVGETEELGKEDEELSEKKF